MLKYELIYFMEGISGLSGVVQILLKNRRRFDQNVGPYQDYKGIFNIIIYQKNEEKIQT